MRGDADEMNAYYLSRQGAVYGPYEVGAVIDMGKDVQFLDGDVLCMVGSDVWMSVENVLSAVMPCPDDMRGHVFHEKGGAAITEKQLAFLQHLGSLSPETLSKWNASDEISMLIDISDCEGFEWLSERRYDWLYNRYKISPKVFAEEIRDKFYEYFGSIELDNLPAKKARRQAQKAYDTLSCPASENAWFDEQVMQGLIELAGGRMVFGKGRETELYAAKYATMFVEKWR